MMHGKNIIIICRIYNDGSPRLYSSLCCYICMYMIECQTSCTIEVNTVIVLLAQGMTFSISAANTASPNADFILL